MITKNFSKSLLRVLALAVLVAVPSVGHAAVASGDVNGDGEINITDISALIDAMLSGEYSAEADVNGDGEITINDINTVIDSIFKGQQGEEQLGDWVDLGLPSGTIWATRNVGASAPEDYGDYFAWGETEPKDYFSWSNYKWCNYNYELDEALFTKYCTKSYSGFDGFVDYKTELDPADDAACAHYPGGRMPSVEQFQELRDNCTWQYVQYNGEFGMLFTGPNGNTMFLPGAGQRIGEKLWDVGDGNYWSRTIDSGWPEVAYDFRFHVYGSIVNNGGNCRTSRCVGSPVRAVRVS